MRCIGRGATGHAGCCYRRLVHSTARTIRTKVVLGLAAALVAAGCDTTEWGPDALLLGGEPVARAHLERGRRVYASYCAGCHGERGDGNGPAARFLDPRPRDFTRGIFKFAAVPSGTLPHDDDLQRTVLRGLYPSAMPEFRLLDETDRRAVVQYIKTFSQRWRGSRPGARIAATEDPFADDDRGGIDHGRRVYHGVAECWSCHPAYASRQEIQAWARADGRSVESFRDRMFDSEPKPSDWGYDILPPNFPISGVKSGSSLEEIYRVVAAGVGGTAMPTWRDSLPERDIWGMVHYTRSLIQMDATSYRRLRSRIGAPGLASMPLPFAAPPFRPSPSTRFAAARPH